MKTPELGPWLQRFFREHLSTQRNVSHATILAYRDTFGLLLRYLRKKHPQSGPDLTLDILTPNTVLSFLEHLEHQRGNSIRTRNARLAAIRCFVHYLTDWLGPEIPVCVPRILAIPRKRQAQRLMDFLNRQEVEAILSATPDTWTGRRDHLLFLLLYGRPNLGNPWSAGEGYHLRRQAGGVAGQGTQTSCAANMAPDSKPTAPLAPGKPVCSRLPSAAQPLRTTTEQGWRRLSTPQIG